MGVQTATVETLQARVEILTVGSRQVTLSMARQVDQVDLYMVEPFGRVRLYPDDSKGHWVIGVRYHTGALVTAKYDPKMRQRPVDTTSYVFEDKVVLCGQRHYSLTPGYMLVYHGLTRMSVLRTDCVDCEADHAHNGWGLVQPESVKAAFQDACRQADEDREPHYKAANMPLIVLAGLR